MARVVGAAKWLPFHGSRSLTVPAIGRGTHSDDHRQGRRAAAAGSVSASLPIPTSRFAECNRGPRPEPWDVESLTRPDTSVSLGTGHLTVLTAGCRDDGKSGSCGRADDDRDLAGR